MTPAGKITFCLLEEDNPQKSYFRIKPVFSLEEGIPAAKEERIALYPDEGGIRIVPDKNEALRFKSRMRTLGRFCLLDLTRHPGENDKIRPNKNYSPERGEFNRNIVYSDVIVPCPDDLAYEVVVPQTDESGIFTLSGDTSVYSRRVLLETGGRISGPYLVEHGGDQSQYTFTPDMTSAPIDCTADQLITFEADEGKVRLYLCPMRKKPEPAAEIKPAAVPECKAEPAPAAEVKPCPSAPAAEAPAKTPEKAEAPEKTQAPQKPEDHEPVSAKVEKRTPYRAEMRESPIGLNPRKGKSLSEIIDDGWRHSRMEQLGLQLPGEVRTNPVVSPVEAAGKAFTEAWKLEDGRAALLDTLSRIEQLPEALADKVGLVPQPAAPRDREMDDLEAERLKLMREVDDLKKDVAARRSDLMQEAREAHKQEIERMEAEKKRLDDECAARQRAARNARSAQSEAEKLLREQDLNRLDDGFLKFALYSRAAQILNAEPEGNTCEYLGTPETYTPTGAQLISDLRRSFEQRDLILTHDEALNILACAALGRIVMVSGPTGCGKTAFADALAAALGLCQPGAKRYVKLPPEVTEARKSPAVRALIHAGDALTPRALLLDDINALPIADQSRGLISFADDPANEDFTLMMSCLDDQIGYPLQPRLLDRAFFLRLKAEKPSGWKKAGSDAPAKAAPALECWKKIFSSDAPLPAEVVSRFAALEGRLETLGIRLSPRTRSDMYAYCAAVIPLMTGTPLEALDRAFAQRALPFLMATAQPDVIKALPDLLCDMPISISLLNQPIALPPM